MMRLNLFMLEHAASLITCDMTSNLKPRIFRRGGVWFCLANEPFFKFIIGRGSSPRKAYTAWLGELKGIY
jgi:hypothetical protein